MKLGSQKGQTSTEYMLIVGVIVLGLLVAAQAFLPEFSEAVKTVGDGVKSCVSGGKCSFGG